MAYLILILTPLLSSIGVYLYTYRRNVVESDKSIKLIRKEIDMISVEAQLIMDSLRDFKTDFNEFRTQSMLFNENIVSSVTKLSSRVQVIEIEQKSNASAKASKTTIIVSLIMGGLSCASAIIVAIIK